MGTKLTDNVNVLGAISWDIQTKFEGPFRHDPASVDAASLYHTGEGSNVRVTVALTLKATDPDTNISLLLLKNEDDYQPQSASSGMLAAGPDAEGVKLQLQLKLRLEKDDSLRVITLQEGADGQVTILPGSALFAVEILE